MSESFTEAAITGDDPGEITARYAAEADPDYGLDWGGPTDDEQIPAEPDPVDVEAQRETWRNDPAIAALVEQQGDQLAREQFEQLLPAIQELGLADDPAFAPAVQAYQQEQARDSFVREQATVEHAVQTIAEWAGVLGAEVDPEQVVRDAGEMLRFAHERGIAFSNEEAIDLLQTLTVNAATEQKQLAAAEESIGAVLEHEGLRFGLNTREKAQAWALAEEIFERGGGDWIETVRTAVETVANDDKRRRLPSTPSEITRYYRDHGQLAEDQLRPGRRERERKVLDGPMPTRDAHGRFVPRQPDGGQIGFARPMIGRNAIAAGA